MIIANGYITIKCKSGGGLDPATGYPTAPTERWSDPVPCQYVPTAQNLQAKSEQEPIAVRRYAIFLEGYEGCAVNLHEQVALYDERDHLIGEYSVKSVTPLLAVDQTRLDV